MTFRRGDGGEQTAIAPRGGTDELVVADAGLPTGWTHDTPAFDAAAAAIRALDAARRLAPVAAVLRDVAGGWDVGLGNVVLGPDACPTCTAHGAMQDDGGTWSCAECGARAELVR